MTSPFTVHARDRALERYGVLLTADDFRVLHAASQDGRAPALQRNVAGTVHVFTHRGVQLIFVVDAAGKAIVTFHPPDAFARGERRKHRMVLTGQRPKQAPIAARNAHRRAKRRDTLASQIAESMGEE